MLQNSSDQKTVLYNKLTPEIELLIKYFSVTTSALSKYLKEIEENEDEVIARLSMLTEFRYISKFNETDFSDFFIYCCTSIDRAEIKEFSDYVINEFMLLHDEIIGVKLYSHQNLLSFYNSIKGFYSEIKHIKLVWMAIKQSKELFDNMLQPKIKEVEEKIKDLESVRLALEMRSTNEIYSNLATKYESESKNYFNYFYICLAISALATLFSIVYYSNFNSINWITFVSIKLLILAIAITLCSIFLKRASHAKKLQDQAYQTHVEIDAFPIHVRSLKEDDKQELIKELALKYFGKELDQTQNDKVGDLMKDQLTAGTELIKASAELVKNIEVKK